MKNSDFLIPETQMSLDLLLSALTDDVVKLKEQAAKRYREDAEWFAVDAASVGEYYEVLLSLRDEGMSNKSTRFGETDTHLHTALPELYDALRKDLLTVSALLDALNHADTKEEIRSQLAKGARTHRSITHGFRWDTSQRYNEHFEQLMLHEDIREFSYIFFGHLSGKDKVVFEADYETLRVVVDDTVEITIPFDEYPFLARAVLQSSSEDDVHEIVRSVIHEVDEFKETLMDRTLREAQRRQDELDEYGSWKIAINK